MSFLPIVRRELLAATRRKSTFRVRWWAALIAIAVSFFALLIAYTVPRGNLGSSVFSTLTGYAFGLCLLAGVFLTADSLSQEKREGTLGLLFLTDLKGYDVVLGKFSAMALHSFYALFALFPLLGLPLLIGGVTGAEFWRMNLALLNMLFFSLATGMCISAFARDSQRTMGNTLGLLILLVVFPLLLGKLRVLGTANGPTFYTWMSPIVPFSYARETMYMGRSGAFWGSLAVSNLLGWILLGFASYALPRRWQQEDDRSKTRGVSGWLSLRSRNQQGQQVRRSSNLIAINPVLWLIGIKPGLRLLLWMIVALWALIVCVAGFVSPGEPLTLYRAAKVCAFLLKMLVAVQACRFFAEARANGALELLLATPLRNADILNGQWLALRKLFLGPLLAFAFLNFLPVGFFILSGVSRRGWDALGDILMGLGGGLVVNLWSMVYLAADVAAVCWVGMWLSLTMRKANLAPALTILLVLVLPSFLCALDIIADLIFILWAYSKLQQDIRWTISRQYWSPPPTILPARATSSLGVPPVISR